MSSASRCGFSAPRRTERLIRPRPSPKHWASSTASSTCQTNSKPSVVDYFCEAYRRGLTPNPCVVCNRLVKFGALLEYADSIGAGYLATGHYARIENTPAGYRLFKAAHGSKDQSYFLYQLNQDQLSRVFFPLGGMTKIQVRADGRSSRFAGIHR